MKNTDAIFQALAESVGHGTMSENVKHQILLKAGSDNSVDNIYKAVGEVLGKGAITDKVRQSTLKRADAIMRGDAKKTEPAKPAATPEQKQQQGTITDTGEPEEVGHLMNEGYNETGGGPSGDAMNPGGVGGAASKAAAATNSGSNYGSGPGGTNATSNASAGL